MKKSPHARGIKPAVYNKDWTKIQDHVHRQLMDGVKIPYYWTAFGSEVMDDYTLNYNEPIMHSRKMINMRNPTRAEMALYQQHREFYENLTSDKKAEMMYP